MTTRLFTFSSLIAAALWLVPTTADADVPLELEASYARGFSTYNAYVPGPGVRVGVGLTERLTLLSGASASASFERFGAENFSLGVPVELKWYLQAPAEGAIVPTLRTGGGFFWQETERVYPDPDGNPYVMEDSRTLGMTAMVLGGVSFFPREKLAVAAEVGPYYTWSHIHDRRQEDIHQDGNANQVQLVWRLSLVYRL